MVYIFVQKKLPVFLNWFISGLKTLRVTINSEDPEHHELTEDEIDLFKRLLVAMSGMEKVKICHLYVSQIYIFT